MSVDWIARRGGPIQGRLRVPGDKSISHRALMLSAIAEGTAHIRGFLEGEDTRATARILQQLGVRIEAPSPGERIVHGVGLRGLRGSEQALDCGNAGTGMRLLAGLLAGQDFASTLVGDESLSARPMARVITPLAAMGAQVESRERGLPPLRINVSNGLHGTDFTNEVASAQVKSAVLLAGLYAAVALYLRETTVGKHAVGLAVRRVDGSRISFGRALVREVVARQLLFVSGGAFLGGLPMLLDLLFPLWDDQAQSLHDKIAGTIVVRAEGRRRPRLDTAAARLDTDA